jgi:hypothetical protein
MEDYVSVATFTNEIEAELAQATLSAASIESFLKYEDIGGMLPVLQESEGIELLVDKKNLLEAKAILSEQATQEPEE